MTEHGLDGAQICATGQKVRRKGMPQDVGRDAAGLIPAETARSLTRAKKACR